LSVRWRGFRERGRKRREIKEREPKTDSDVRRGRSHRSLDQGYWMRGAGDNMGSDVGSRGARD